MNTMKFLLLCFLLFLIAPWLIGYLLRMVRNLIAPRIQDVSAQEEKRRVRLMVWMLNPHLAPPDFQTRKVLEGFFERRARKRDRNSEPFISDRKINDWKD
jgi:hypothetical protein